MTFEDCHWSDVSQPPLRLERVYGSLRGEFVRSCDELQRTFLSLAGDTPWPDDVAASVRGDTVAILRRDLGREATTITFQWAYAILRDLFCWSAALVLAALVVSNGPSWLEAVVVTAFVVGVPAVGVSNRISVDDGIHDLVASTAAAIVVLGMLLLLARPETGFGVLEVAGVVLVAAICSLAVVRLIDAVLRSIRQIMPATLVVLALVAIAIGLWGYVDIDRWPLWIERALAVGITVGLATGILLGGLQLASTLHLAVSDALKIRRIPQAEFVQTSLETVRMAIEGLENRRTIVQYLEYLARCLQQGVAGELIRDDPSSATLVARQLASRAEALRMRKREVLFSQPGALDAVVEDLRDAIAPAATGRWLALPVAQQQQDTLEESPRQRRSRVAARILFLAVPVVLTVVAWATDRTDVVPFTAAWSLISVIELLTPGAGAKLSETAGQARGLNPFAPVPGKG
jgi:hypothetical protein